MAGFPLPVLAQRVRFQPELESELLVLSFDSVRKSLIVPRVKISSVEMPLRPEWPFAVRSMDGVGVRDLLEDEDEDPELRLKVRKSERPLDLGHWVTEMDWTFVLGNGGGKGIGVHDGETGRELPPSLGVDAGVVVPGVVEGSVSLFRFEDPKLLRLEVSSI